ncbi:unnamed protein product [Prorocentrum cordatum]|uniref:Uncharacterized protein n=1 Tax=Prorocentrum cordatum TaxID=2364126 RepID=A0ABN9R0U4_9DINO|nr:unnamed protein product [Polarella glacialis]
MCGGLAQVVEASRRAGAPLHRHLKKFAVVLQWYTVLFVGFVVFSAVSLVVFMKDILFVSAEAREDNLREMFELSTLGNVTFEEFEAGLSVGTFVTTANVFGQIAGPSVGGRHQHVPCHGAPGHPVPP